MGRKYIWVMVLLFAWAELRGQSENSEVTPSDASVFLGRIKATSGEYELEEE